MEHGTDNEAWGGLIDFGLDKYSMGADLPNIEFCPWCGKQPVLITFDPSLDYPIIVIESMGGEDYIARVALRDRGSPIRLKRKRDGLDIVGVVTRWDMQGPLGAAVMWFVIENGKEQREFTINSSY